MRKSAFLVSTSALGCAAAFSLFALSTSSPASADFVCTTTATDITCANSGTAAAPFLNDAAGANQNAITTNSGTANGFLSETDGGGNATATNTGNNVANGIQALTTAGGDATATNSGSNAGSITAQTILGGNATATNSGSLTGGMLAETIAGGNATATNSGNNGMAAAVAETANGGDATATNSGTTKGLVATAQAGNATAINSGTNLSGTLAATVASGNATVTNSSSSAFLVASTSGSGNATVTNSGSVGANGILASAAGGGTGSGDALVNNSGTSSGSIIATADGTSGNAMVINSGLAAVPAGFDAIVVVSTNGNATLTNVLSGRVIGGIVVNGLTGNNVNFVGGNWLQTIDLGSGGTTINASGAPFVVVPTATGGIQVAVLDPTTFALADRSLTNVTGEISEMLQDRFAGMSAGAGGPGALGFAGAPNSSAADQAQAAFSGIPSVANSSVAMSYASGASRPVIGKAPASVPYYDTTIWASGFGGERHQRADGVVLPTDDTAFGDAMGVDRTLGSNLRLGAFIGAGASREAVELNVQTIDATYVFGGAYGRFDWISQYLDFSLYGGGIDNRSTRQVANNLAPGGLENATASYGGWFISPEITYGYRIPFNAITVTPRVRLRYVGGQLDGYSESGSMQNLSVGSRSINDLEERGEVELSTVAGAFKGSATVGIIGLERLGNPNINTVLLGQNLSFVTPGQASAFGGVFGMRMEYRVIPNASLFVAGEATAMSDKSDSFAATGGARMSF